MNTAIAIIVFIVVIAAIVWAAKRSNKSDAGNVTPGTGPITTQDPGTGASPGKEIR